MRAGPSRKKLEKMFDSAGRTSYVFQVVGL